MKIDKHDTAAGVDIVVGGDVDMENSPKLRDVIKRCLKDRPQVVRVRLDDVPYIDSSGIAVLIEGMKWCKKKGCEFRLVDISDNVRGVLELSKLLPVFTVEKS